MKKNVFSLYVEIMTILKVKAFLLPNLSGAIPSTPNSPLIL